MSNEDSDDNEREQRPTLQRPTLQRPTLQRPGGAPPAAPRNGGDDVENGLAKQESAFVDERKEEKMDDDDGQKNPSCCWKQRWVDFKSLCCSCSRPTFYMCLWLLWLLVGTLYYSFENELGILVGFYQAVNIGYSIGYGYPREPSSQNWWFSSLYVVTGASFVGVALGFFADQIVADSDDWFSKSLENERYEEDTAPDKPLRVRARAFVRGNKTLLRPIGIWMCWVAVMITYSMISVRWPFSAAQYFAVSTCSTGGHMPIPDDSPQWLFGVTGIFAAIGVPLMGVAMASLGSLVMERGHDDLEETKKIIEEEVTAEELLDLQRYGLEDGDGEIDRAEYVILCMVRLGTDPRLVQFISEYFKKLDDDGSNSLSILEITRGRVSCEDLQRLSRSEQYTSSRRLLKLDDSLGSIHEHEEEKEDLQKHVRAHLEVEMGVADDTDSEGDKFCESVAEELGEVGPLAEEEEEDVDIESPGGTADTYLDESTHTLGDFSTEGICF